MGSVKHGRAHRLGSHHRRAVGGQHRPEQAGATPGAATPGGVRGELRSSARAWVQCPSQQVHAGVVLLL
jgi:hypothetical protein